MGADLAPLSMVSMPASTANHNGQGFPLSAHRTGRAVFPHPALGRESHPSMHRRPGVWASAWLGHQAPRGVAGSYAEFLGSRQSPDPCLGEAPLEPGLLPSPPVVRSAECPRYDEPLRLPTWRHPEGGSRRDASPRGISRVALCAVPTCHAHYPGEEIWAHRSGAPPDSSGLPGYSGRSALATSRSRPAQTSHRLRPVGSRTHPQWASVPRASTSQLPFWPSWSLRGCPDDSPDRTCTGETHSAFSRRTE